MSADVWAAYEAADLAKRGLWPVAGGWLDQTAIGLAAIRAFWSELDYCEAKLKAAAYGH